MPADYQTTAERLAVSPSRATPSPPPWSRHQSSALSGRLAMARIRSYGNSSSRPWVRRTWTYLEAFNEQSIRTYRRMTPLQRGIVLLSIILFYVLVILAGVYSHRLFEWLAGISESWRALRGGWLICFFLVFITSFPPVIGYSTANTIAGFVYGFPWAWPIVASACTIGSLCCFVASRTFLAKYVDRMVGKDPRFVALGQVLRRDGILYLTGIRFCPLPFSLSNGFLATIPSITPMAFALSTALSSPKLLVHVFIGSRLAILAESGDKMSAGDKAINYFSMAVGAAVGVGVGWVIYRRTMDRAAEVALEDGVEAGLTGPGYLDTQDALMDPEDVAALMSDDDLSLWDTQIDNDGYQDDDDGSDGSNTNGHKRSVVRR